jgi:hypothetical protein
MAVITFSSAGTKVSLSSGKPTGAPSATTLSALTYTEIGGVSEVGMLGPESSVIVFNPLSDNISYKQKGQKNAGALDCKGALNNEDAGQILLQAAEASPEEYALKIELTNGSTLYCMILVTSFKTNIGNSGQITMFESKLEISGNVFTQAAA